MKTSFDGYNLSLGEAKNTVRVGKNGNVKELFIPPLSLITVDNEIFSPASKSRWDIAPLQNRTSSSRIYTVPDAVKLETVKLYSVNEQGQRQQLALDTDYELDRLFCGIKLKNGWTTETSTFAIDYQMRLQRVDVIAVKDGEVKLFCGSESLTSPRWPLLPAGWQGIARIYLRFCDELTEKAIYEITDPKYSRLINYIVLSDSAARMPGSAMIEHSAEDDSLPWPEAVDYKNYIKSTPAALERLRNKFISSEEFNLVYFGDSITQGGDVTYERRFYNRFNRYLTTHYPQKKLTLINTAVGGTNSTFGRERFQRDVLDHKPDVVTILFVLNDKSMPDETALDNHKYFIEELRKINAEPVLFTSNLNTAVWLPGLDHAEQRIIDFCRQEDLICLDAFNIWKDLPTMGIPYETLLFNGINHPDDIAAGVFYNLLLDAFFGK